MTPKLLLALWRDRWAKTDQGIPNRPYARGRVHQWLYSLSDTAIWDSLILRLIILAACIFVFTFTLQLEFPLNSQISFAALIIAMIIAARRFEGSLFTFIVMALGSVTCAQYFYWRMTKTIIHRTDIELLISVGYCAVELLFCFYLFLRLYSQTWPTQTPPISRPWMYRVKTTIDILFFYKSLGRFIVTVMPVIGLVLGYRIFKLQSEWILPMTAPYLVTLAVMAERLDSNRRWGLFKAVYEIFLALVLSIRNAWAFVSYSTQHLALFFKRSVSSPTEPFVALKSLIDFVLITLNLFAATIGITRLATDAASGSTDVSMVLMTLIASTNIISLLCAQAIAHESRHIQSFTNQCKTQAATIVLVSGRTYRCKTRNFPAEELELQLPGNLACSLAGTFMLQFSHDHQPFNLTVHTSKAARSDPHAGTIITVQCHSESTKDFHRLKNSIMVRDPNWPRWLAHKSADKLLPDWISRKLETVPITIIDWMTKALDFMKIKNLFKLIKTK